MTLYRALYGERGLSGAPSGHVARDPVVIDGVAQPRFTRLGSSPGPGPDTDVTLPHHPHPRHDVVCLERRCTCTCLPDFRGATP